MSIQPKEIEQLLNSIKKISQDPFVWSSITGIENNDIDYYKMLEKAVLAFNLAPNYSVSLWSDNILKTIESEVKTIEENYFNKLSQTKYINFVPWEGDEPPLDDFFIFKYYMGSLQIFTNVDRKYEIKDVVKDAVKVSSEQAIQLFKEIKKRVESFYNSSQPVEQNYIENIESIDNSVKPSQGFNISDTQWQKLLMISVIDLNYSNSKKFIFDSQVNSIEFITEIRNALSGNGIKNTRFKLNVNVKYFWLLLKCLELKGHIKTEDFLKVNLTTITSKSKINNRSFEKLEKQFEPIIPDLFEHFKRKSTSSLEILKKKNEVDSLFYDFIHNAEFINKEINSIFK